MNCRFIVMARLLLFAGLIFNAPVVALGQPDFPVVTNLLQLHRLATENRRILCSLRLEGVVCAASLEKGVMVLQDGSGPKLLELDLQGRAVRPGQRVRLEADGCSVTLSSVGLVLGRSPVVDNDGFHPLARKSGMVYLKTGRHPIRLAWFNGPLDQELKVHYEGPDLPRQRIPDAALFRAQAAGEGGATNLVNGLEYRCYERSWGRFVSDFCQGSPVSSGTTTNFDLGVRTRDRNVGLEFAGYLAVPRDGLYTFDTESDDGSQLFVGEPAPRLEVLGTGAAPVPRRLTLGQVPRQDEEGQWAELEGTVSFVSEQGGHLELELRAGSGRVQVGVVDSAGFSPALLWHSRIRAAGVCASAYTPEGQKIAGRLAVLSRKEMALLEAAPELWNVYPLMTISNALRAAFPAGSEAIVHVRGSIRSLGPDQAAVAEDETGQVRVDWPPAAGGGEAEVEVLARRRGFGTNAVLEFGVCRTAAGDRLAKAERLPVLTTGEQVKQLKREEARRGYPVRLQGVVTRVGPSTMAIVLQDSTRGVYVSNISARDFNMPQIGEFWEVEGVTAPGDFAPVVLARRASRLGWGVLPDPVHPTWDQLMNGSLDTQYVEIQGIVTAVRINQVELLLPEGKIKLTFPELKPESLPRYQNTLIRVRGCLLPAWDARTHRLKVGEVLVFNASLSADEPAQVDLFSTPMKHAAELLLYDLRAGAFRRVRAAGQILGAREGQYFMLDGTNGLRFIVNGAAGLEAGDLAEVVGFPELGGPSPILREAVVRKTGHAALPEARRLRPDNLIHKEYDATRVRVEGVLVNRHTEGGEPALELRVGLRTVVARLKAGEEFARSLAAGSRLELTGVYVGQGSGRAAGGEIDAFELVLHSTADVRVLSRPPWWTFHRVLGALGAVAVVLLGATIWALSLRRQVSAQTEIIRQKAQREATLEERARIAKDIHDDLGSHLTFIMMLGELSRDDLARPKELAVHISKIVAYARAAVQSLDEIVWAVNPENDTLDGLAGYLNQYVSQCFESTAVRCRLEIPESLSPVILPAEIRHDLFLAVKEALNNALKHAAASEVRVVVAETAGTVEIMVEDNGRGFAPDAICAGSRGNGLANMRKRMARAGGEFCLTSAPGQGTRLKFTVRVGRTFV